MKVSEFLDGAYGTMYYVVDMKKSVQYYREMFDLAPTMESPEWTEFNFNGHTICLHAVAPGAKVDGKGIFIAKVKGLTNLVAELKSRGMEFTGEIKNVCEGGYSADFHDPSGNLLSLFEYTGK